MNSLDALTRSTGSSTTTKRVPPGQHLVHDWPVLTAGLTPIEPPIEDWRFAIHGLVGHPMSWSLDELKALRAEQALLDLHCVTGWSRLDVAIEGLRLSHLIQMCEPVENARFVSAVSCDGYDANLTLPAALRNAWLVWAVDDKLLTRAHGGPLRLMVEGQYFWKSVKWLFSVDVLAADRPGYWETRGYHNDGDPWKEQRTTVPEIWTPYEIGAAQAQTSTLRTIVLQNSRWTGHIPGQHVRVQVPLADGSFASRAYSISSLPTDGSFEITVDRLDGGQASPVLHALETGSVVNVSGPSGTEFQRAIDAPALYIAAGSGVSPLMSMRRAGERASRQEDHLILSVRNPGDLPFAGELEASVTVCYTRNVPADYPRPAGRLTLEDVSAVANPDGQAYVCGPSAFVDFAGKLLMECGYPAEQIRTQRYGPG